MIATICRLLLFSISIYSSLLGEIYMSATDQARVLMMRHHHFIKNRQQSMLSRVSAEVGLPADVAAHHWNPVQGKPNASFRMSYDRSGVGLS
jgi:hypothetical protein